jgi:hypothetical protein
VHDPDTVGTALSLLIRQRPPVVPSDPSLILALLFQTEYREKVLRLLSIAPPKVVSPGLLEALAADQGAHLALVRIARTAHGAGLMENAGMWLMTERPVMQQLQIVLALLTNPENRRAVLALEGVPRLFAALAADGESVFVELIGPLLKKCPINVSFVARLVDSGFLRGFVDAVKELDNEQTYMKAYALVEALAPVKWVDDFGAFAETANCQLHSPTTTEAAQSYLAMIRSSSGL